MSVKSHCIDPGEREWNVAVHVESKHVGPCRTNASATCMLPPTQSKTCSERGHSQTNSTCGAGWKKHPMPGKIFPTLWLMVQTALADSYYLFLVSRHILSPSACQQTTAAFTRLSTAPCHFMARCSKSVAATICFNISRCLSNFLFLTAPLPLAVGAF